MGSQEGQPLDLRRTEDQATRFHEHDPSTAPACELWRDGLNLLLRALDPISGYTIPEQHQEDRVILPLFISAWKSAYCAFDLALRGYYPQALNLLRPPIEHWMAYWYLRNFPQEHVRFAGSSASKTPEFNDMLQKVEAGQGQGRDTCVRTWIKRLHPWSHVDGAGVLAITRREGPVTYLELGPQHDARLFGYCADEAALALAMLLEALDNFCRPRDLGGITEFPDFEQRVLAHFEGSATKDTEPGL